MPISLRKMGLFALTGAASLITTTAQTSAVVASKVMNVSLELANEAAKNDTGDGGGLKDYQKNLLYGVAGVAAVITIICCCVCCCRSQRRNGNDYSSLDATLDGAAIGCAVGACL